MLQFVCFDPSVPRSRLQCTWLICSYIRVLGILISCQERISDLYGRLTFPSFLVPG